MTATFAALLGTSAAPVQNAVPGGPHSPLLRNGSGGGGPAQGEVVPAAGGVGTDLVIQDNIALAVPNLPNFEAKDILLTSTGERGYLGRCSNVSPTGITGVIAEGDPYPEPETAFFEFGIGVEQQIPPLFGMTYPNPVWGWRGDPADPVNYDTYESGTTFELAGASTGTTCSDEMPRKIWSFFYLDSNGSLRAPLPGPSACAGDQFTINLELEVCDTTTTPPEVSRYALILPPTGVALQNTDWLVANFWLVTPIAGGFFNVGLATSPSFDAGTNELVIALGAGLKIQGLKRKSFIAIVPGTSQYTLFSELAGDKLNQSYGDPVDDASPRTDFACWALNALAGVSLHGTKHYDQADINPYFLDSFESFGDQSIDGFVRAAVLEIKLKAGGGSPTDHIRLGYDQCSNPTVCDPDTVTGMSWTERLENLAALGGQWNSGDEATLCFNVNILPESDGTLTSILDLFECGDFFDIVVDDDTLVDYAELKVWRCNP